MLTVESVIIKRKNRYPHVGKRMKRARERTLSSPTLKENFVCSKPQRTQTDRRIAFENEDGWNSSEE
jgi:hypothetical protein